MHELTSHRLLVVKFIFTYLPHAYVSTLGSHTEPCRRSVLPCSQIVHELTSHRVLVMEFIDNAVGVSDLAGLREMGIK